METNKHIVRTNALRHWINRQMAIKNSKHTKQKMWVRGHDYDQPDCLVFVGLPVLCYSTNKKIGCFNGKIYSVSGYTKTEITLKELGGGDKEITIKRSSFCRNFCAGYAMTAEAVQGQTLSEPFTIHQWTGSAPNRRHEYTALTRTSKVDYVNISNKVDQCFLSDSNFNKFKKKVHKDKFSNIRSEVTQLRKILKGEKLDSGFCLKITGLEYVELKKHLCITSETPWSEIDIDHKKALKKMSKEELVEANHYSNLQVLFKSINKSKGAKI